MKIIKLFVLLGVTLILSKPLLACVGARPMAMGGAFTGLSDDINAVYWNPAGLAQVENRQVTYTGTLKNRDEYNYDDFVAYAQPIQIGGTIGVSFINSGYDQSQILEYKERWFVLSYGRAVGENFFLGGNIRRISSEYSFLDYSPYRGYYQNEDDDSAMEIDLSLFWQPRDNFSIGLLIQNFNEPKLFGVERIRNVRPGIVFKPNDQMTLTLDIYDFLGESDGEALDVSQDLRFGIEAWITEMFALRGGLYHINSKVDSMKALTLGAGYTLSDTTPLRIDYCMLYWFDRPSDSELDDFTHQLGATYQW